MDICDFFSDRDGNCTPWIGTVVEANAIGYHVLSQSAAARYPDPVR